MQVMSKFILDTENEIHQLTVLVLSARANFAQRQALRDTWIKDANNYRCICIVVYYCILRPAIINQLHNCNHLAIAINCFIILLFTVLIWFLIILFLECAIQGYAQHGCLGRTSLVPIQPPLCAYTVSLHFVSKFCSDYIMLLSQ